MTNHTGAITSVVCACPAAVPYTVSPVETNCIVKYSTWPQPTTTTINNEGTAGAGYQGTAAANRYAALPSGATAFVDNGAAAVHLADALR